MPGVSYLLGLSFGDRMVLLCIGIYLLITFSYLLSREWWKALYYLAATILNVAVPAMKS